MQQTALSAQRVEKGQEGLSQYPVKRNPLRFTGRACIEVMCSFQCATARWRMPAGSQR
jgi:hypothetical protein